MESKLQYVQRADRSSHGCRPAARPPSWRRHYFPLGTEIKSLRRAGLSGGRERERGALKVDFLPLPLPKIGWVAARRAAGARSAVSRTHFEPPNSAPSAAAAAAAVAAAVAFALDLLGLEKSWCERAIGRLCSRRRRRAIKSRAAAVAAAAAAPGIK